MSRRSRSIVAALVITLLVAAAYGTWLDWDWKAMAGWRPLVGYIEPKDATGRKDAVQVYAVIAAGVIASITAGVGLLNLRLTRKNLEQQRELEVQRAEQQRHLEAQRAEQQRQLAQGTALQAYYEQIGKLLTDKDLRNTKLKEIRELARGQTMTVVREVDGTGKRSLLTFLHGAGLIEAENPAVSLSGADLREAYLKGANLQGDLRQADLRVAHHKEANLQYARLRGAHLQQASLLQANLRGAYLKGAEVTDQQLEAALSLQGAIMPDGSKHP